MNENFNESIIILLGAPMISLSMMFMSGANMLYILFSWFYNMNLLFYKNEKISNFPPGYNIYVRILTETGLIGFLIFLSLIILIFFLCLNIIKSKSDEKNVLGTVLLVSFIGFFINWLQIDSFRIYGIWICFAILILFDNKLIKKHILEKDVKGIAN